MVQYLVDQGEQEFEVTAAVASNIASVVTVK
jgi:hypothetical protein